MNKKNLILRFRPWALAAGLSCLIPAAFPPAAAADDGWPFPRELRARLVFVHPLVNYAVDPVWQRRWERSLNAASGLQLTSGSVSTDDLYSDLMVNITESAGSRFRFLYRTEWREGLHLDRERHHHWLGFAGRMTGPLSAFLQVHPPADKEELDLQAGLLLTDASRERFLRIGLRWDDFLYGDKNELGAVSHAEPVSVIWELRHRAGPWEVFSTGGYGSGSRRSYPDSVRSPAAAAGFERQGAGTLRLRRIWSDRDFLSLEASHYRFEGEQESRPPGQDFTYRNEWVHLRMLVVRPLGRSWTLRPEVHWLRQWSRAEGLRRFHHRREDIFPAVFLQRHGGGKSRWELGYMATHYRWRGSYEGAPDRGDGFTDKIKLGWTWAFLPTARLQLSLSHEVDLERFGGFNVQYQMIF